MQTDADAEPVKANAEQNALAPVDSDAPKKTDGIIAKTDESALPDKPLTAAVKADAPATAAKTDTAQAAPNAPQVQLHSPAQQIAAATPVAEIQGHLRAPTALERVPFEITAATHRGEKEFSIRLDPADLGRVDVSVSIDKGGKVSTHLVVERAETLDQLRRDAPNLERALQNSGLKTDSGSLQFSLRDQGSQNFSQNQSDGRQTRRGVVEVDLTQLNGWGQPHIASLGNARGRGVDLRI